MIRIKFDPNSLDGILRTTWDAWAVQARAATIKVIKAYEEWQPEKPGDKFTYDWEDKVWKSLKDFMLAHVVHGKCAYCEVKEIRSPYHAEHFRPKGMVRFKNLGEEDLLKAEIDCPIRGKIEHPGYFWLAYHWQNLLPSCAFCNAHEGKKNQFPISKLPYLLTVKLKAEEVARLKETPYPSPNHKDRYYLLSQDLSAYESPFLVNPLVDDPREHICFGDFGIEAPLSGSLKGAHSIEVYDLKNPSLRTERQIAQEEADNRFMAAKQNCRNAPLANRIAAGKAAMKTFSEGKEQYSAAVLDYLMISQGVTL
jgi:hypothetical protein